MEIDDIDNISRDTCQDWLWSAVWKWSYTEMCWSEELMNCHRSHLPGSICRSNSVQSLEKKDLDRAA